MKRRSILASIAIAIFAVPTALIASAVAEEIQCYRHPQLDFQFSAPAGWVTFSRPEDAMIFEKMDEGTGIHVVLWYTATQQDAQGYLRKMADMKTVVIDGRNPRRKEIDGREAWVFDVSAKNRGKAVHTLLAVINGGADHSLPDHRALYIVEIWCPAERHPWLGEQMDHILATVRIDN
jgi:predicted Zn-dependent protease